MRIGSAFAAGALFLGVGSYAQDAALTTDTILVAENEQVLQQRLIVDAPIDVVWEKFTTTEGVSSWMAPVASVDLRSGGSIRTHYNPCAQIGESGTISLKIVNFVPRKFLILKSDLDAASGAEWMTDAIKARAPDMANLIQFEAVSETKTRLTSWGLGYGQGEDWQAMIGFFNRGNEWSFKQLRRALKGDPVYAACSKDTN